MKTKYLIAMLAAPMFFTACSQDELVDSVPGAEKIEGTPYGDQLTFNVGGDEASTRITTGGKWEAGDRIGMAWITDGYKDGVTDITGDLNPFTSATKVIGNVPLDFVSGSAFKSNTMMFVGTYLAYSPFNKELMTVSELELSVGANQISKDLAEAYNKTIFASDTLSLQAANAGTGKTPSINLKRLSNMLVLDICLKADVAKMPNVVIQKVELDLQSSSASVLASAGTVSPKDWTATNTKDGEEKFFKKLASATTGYLIPAKVGTITATAEEAVAVSKENMATIYLNFMPSDLSALDATKSVINIYTNYGVIKSSITDAVKMFGLKADKTYETTSKTVAETFGGYDLQAGQLIKKKVEIDLAKVSVDEMTATNAAEVRNIIKNWKLIPGTATTIKIKVTHDAAYLEKFDDNEKSGKDSKNIKLDGLDLSDIPANLTIWAKDTLEFTGATNLNAAKTIYIKNEDGTGAMAVAFNGETSIGTLETNDRILFNENTTIYGTLTQVPTTAKNDIAVAVGKTLTVNAGTLVSNTPIHSVLNNGGTINLINSGSINGKDAATTLLTINNFSEILPATTPKKYNKGTINVGDADSEGYLAGTNATSFDNVQGTLRFFNGNFVAPGEGNILAVAQNALQFNAAVGKKVTTIEITGDIKFSAFDLSEADGKTTKVIMKSGSTLSMGAKSITLGNVEVAENATISGTKLTVFGGKLSVKSDAILTVGDNTTINANILDLPTKAQIQGNEKTSKVVYKTAGLVGGTYTANVTQNASLPGVN